MKLQFDFWLITLENAYIVHPREMDDKRMDNQDYAVLSFKNLHIQSNCFYL